MEDQGKESLRGKLLIAAPSLFDFFRRTVVLMVEHGPDGAFGVVLNRDSETTVAEAVPSLAEVLGAEEKVRIGGPVGPESVVLLGQFADPSDSPKIVVGDLGVVDPGEEAELRRARVYAGHSGWSPGQLESELDREAWLVEPASPEDPFFEGDLWEAVLKRRGGEYALLARMPEDPSLN
ncbi:MAG: YqgE/AlgH family protein [Solirubrobacterales bacterium]